MITIFAIFMCSFLHGQPYRCSLWSPAQCVAYSSDGCVEWEPYISMEECRRKVRALDHGHTTHGDGQFDYVCLKKEVPAWSR